MKIVGVYCPNCGGNVRFTMETERNHCFCSHCGQQIILDDEVIRSEHTERTIDEARIREVDAKALVELEHLKLYEMALADYHKRKIMRVVLSILWGVLVVALIIFGIVYYNVTWDEDTVAVVCGLGGTALAAIGACGLFVPALLDAKPQLPKEENNVA